MTPHPHKDAIVAWAHGETIEVRHHAQDKWFVEPFPSWDLDKEYRIRVVEPEWIFCNGKRPSFLDDDDRIFWYGPKNSSIYSTVRVKDLFFNNPNNPVLFVKIAKEAE